MGWLEKLLNGQRTVLESNKQTIEETYKTKLKGILYDDELVEELAPVFASLHDKEGFDKVFQLLETKEKQLEKVVGGEWYSQSTGNDEKEINTDNENTEEEADEKEVSSAEEILAKQFESSK